MSEIIATIGDFGWALQRLREGAKVTRIGWKNPNIWIELQVPDDRSKMTKPYLFMVKYEDKFPTDLSCESILSDDWEEVV